MEYSHDNTIPPSPVVTRARISRRGITLFCKGGTQIPDHMAWRVSEPSKRSHYQIYMPAVYTVDDALRILQAYGGISMVNECHEVSYTRRYPTPSHASVRGEYRAPRQKPRAVLTDELVLPARYGNFKRPRIPPESLPAST